MSEERNHGEPDRFLSATLNRSRKEDTSPFADEGTRLPQLAGRVHEGSHLGRNAPISPGDPKQKPSYSFILSAVMTG
jgi:hypothetical protein